MKTVKITEKRMALLFFLKEQGKKEGISIRNIAKELNISKSTVARDLSYFREAEIIGEDSLQLTLKGEGCYDEYLLAFSDLTKRIMGHGVPKEAAEQCARTTLGKSSKANASKKKNKSVPAAQGKVVIPESYSFSDKKIDYLIEDGLYNADFLFLARGEDQRWSLWSGEEEGSLFGRMKIHRGVGTLFFKKNQKREKNSLGKLEIFHEGQWEPVKEKNGEYAIPTMWLSFSYREKNQTLSGYATVRRDGEKALFISILQVE